MHLHLYEKMENALENEGLLQETQLAHLIHDVLGPYADFDNVIKSPSDLLEGFDPHVQKTVTFTPGPKLPVHGPGVHRIPPFKQSDYLID